MVGKYFYVSQLNVSKKLTKKATTYKCSKYGDTEISVLHGF